MKKPLPLLAALVLSVLTAFPAKADLISIQFSPRQATSGAAAGTITGASATDIWNVFGAGPPQGGLALVNTVGVATPITLDYNASFMFTPNNFPSNFGGVAGVASPPTELANGFLDKTSGGNNIVITLHGFVPNSPVDLTVYAQQDDRLAGNQITVNGVTHTIGSDSGAGGIPHAYVVGTNVADFFGEVLATAGGDVVITDVHVGNDIFAVATINGLQISGAPVQVPEPASLALLAVTAAGSAGSAWRRRRKDATSEAERLP
jgi:hypothetical protein